MSASSSYPARRRPSTAPDDLLGTLRDRSTPVLITDFAGVVLDANRAAVRLLSEEGCDRLAGTRISDHFARDAAAPIQAALRAACEGESPKAIQVSAWTVSDQPRRLRCKGWPVPTSRPSILWTLRPVRGIAGVPTDGRLGPEAEAQLLLRATLELLKARSAKHVAARAVGVASRTLADGAAIYFEAEDGIRCVAAAPENGTVQVGAPISDEDSLFAAVLRDGSTRRIDDPATLVRLFGAGQSAAEAPPRCALLLALRTRGRSTELGRGVLALLYRTPIDGRLEGSVLLRAFASVVDLSLGKVEELEESKRALRAAEMTGRGQHRAMVGLCHDCRAPIQAISGYVELLRMASEEFPARSRTHLQALKDSVGHLTALLDSAAVLEQAMHEGPLPVSEVALLPLLQQVRAVAAEAARVKGIELVIPHVGDDVSIRTHSGSLAKVLVNLLDNAIKYTDDGTVELQLDLADDEATITVRDTGRGIPAREIDHVFEPFWRGHDRGTITATGFGIGLTVVKDLVHRLNGEISLESAVGDGTTVVLTLPR